MASSGELKDDEHFDEEKSNDQNESAYPNSQSLNSTVGNTVFKDCTFNFETPTASSNFPSQLSIALIVELVVIFATSGFQYFSSDEKTFAGVIFYNLINILILIFVMVFVFTLFLFGIEYSNRKKAKSKERNDKGIKRMMDYVRDSILAEDNTEI